MGEEYGKGRSWDPRVDDILRRLGRLEDTVSDDHTTVAGLAKDLPRMHAENTTRFDRIETTSRTTSVLVDEARGEVKQIKETIEANDKAVASRNKEVARRSDARDRWIRWGVSTLVAGMIPSFIVNIPHAIHQIAETIARLFR